MADPADSLGEVLAATFARPLDDPAYRANALVPDGLPLEVSFSELQPDQLRLDLQPSDVECSAAARREAVLGLVQLHSRPGCGESRADWLPCSAASRFGAFLGAAFGPHGLTTIKAYLELDHAVDPGSLPGRLGAAAALVAEHVPGVVPHLVAMTASEGSAACPERVYLACRGGLRVSAFDGLLARLGLRHRWPALAAAVSVLTGGRLLLPEDSVLVAIGEHKDGFELKVELLADALAGPQAQTLAAIERLLQDRPASLAAFRQWRHAVGEATRISVVSVRLAGDDLPRLNVYQSIAVPARLSP